MESKKIKILVIDDINDNLIAIDALIKEAFPSAVILTALNGAKGLEIAALENPDVILLDIVMPGIDGYEVCRMLKANLDLSDIPVVFVTSLKGNKESRILALEVGAEAFLAKPIDEHELTAQIRAMVKIKNAHLERRNRNELLSILVEERTKALKITHSATLNLMEDVRKENEGRRKSEESLKLSEKKYRLITEKISDVVWIMDLNGKSTFVSPSIEKFTGFSVEEYLNQGFDDRFTPESALNAYETFKIEVSRYMNTEGPPKDYKKTMIMEYRCKDGGVKTGEVLITPDFDEMNVFVGLYGVTRDITERKIAQDALVKSEERLKDIIFNSADWVWEVNEKGKYTYSSDKGVDFFGTSRGNIIGMTPFDFMLPEEAKRISKVFAEIIENKSNIRDLENWNINDKGESICLLTNGVPILDKLGNLKGFRGVDKDITQRKLAEAELEESREKYRGLSEATFESIFISEKGVCIEQNQTAERMFGYTSEEAIGRFGTDWIVPEDREMVMNNMLLGNELPYEATAITKAGVRFPCMLRGRMMRYKGKDVRVTSLSDITERIEAEFAMRESEKKYFNLYTLMRLMSDTMPDMLWAKDLNNKFIFANKAICENLLGAVDTSEPIGKDDYFFAYRERNLHPEDPNWHTFGELCVNSDQVTTQEMKHKQFDEFGNVKGKFLYLDVHKAPLFNDKNEFIGLVGSARDVTERKKAEGMFEDIIVKNPLSIQIVDLNGYTLKVNPAHTELFGAIPPSEYSIFDDLQRMNPELEELFVLLRKGEIIHLPDQFFNVKNLDVNLPDKPVWIRAIIFPLTDSNGSPEKFVLLHENITASKEAEDAIRESERLLRESQSIAKIGSFAWEIADNLWRSSSILDEIFGIDKNYPHTYEGWVKIIHPDWREIMLNYVANDVLGKGQKFDKEYQIIRHSDGKECWVLGLAELEKDANNEPEKLIGSIIDITERKQAEKTISMLAHAIRSVSECVSITDMNDNVIFVNNAFIETYQFKENEVLGRNISMIRSSNNSAEIIKEIIPKTLDGGWHGELINRRKDGSEFPVLVSSSVIHGEYDEPLALIGIATDISVRKKAERELQENRDFLKKVLFTSTELIDINSGGLDFKKMTDILLEISGAKYAVFNLFDEEGRDFTSVALSGISEMKLKTSAFLGYEVINKKWKYDHEREEKIKDQTITKFNSLHDLAGIVIPKSVSSLIEKAFNIGEVYLVKITKNQKSIGDFTLIFQKGASIRNNEIIELFANQIGLYIMRKKAEELLKESEEKLSALFGTMTEMVALYDLVSNKKGEVINFRINDCNAAFSNFLGLSKEDVVGKFATDVFPLGFSANFKDLAQVGINGEPFEYDTYIAQMDKHFMVSAISPKKNSFATIFTDITAIKQIQDVIFAKNKELENFLYITSHDLRTPLVNIQGFSKRFLKQFDLMKTLLEECNLDNEIKDNIEKITNEGIPKTLHFILSNVTKMDTLINGLLQISRTGRVKMVITNVNMTKLFKTIIATHNFQITDISAKVVVEEMFDCWGDENQLNQLFSNIIGNALKYRDKNREMIITISAKTLYNKVIYSIKDTGLGIGPRHLDKIWDVFYRVDAALPEAGEGIGLSFSKRITEKHKGKIWAESEEGVGTTFYVELQKNIFVE